ncbi:MAG TPA: hypothetical protein VG733_18495 [Chthoniobacteraceae bacterium]|nr:hypothetical protein [Chthoniobacteraceae bacterium]
MTSRSLIQLLPALIVIAVFQPRLLAKDEKVVLSQNEIADIKTASLALLRDIRPVQTPGARMKTMEIAGGTVYWGHLFDPNEITALVNLAPATPDHDWLEDHPPRYLSFFVWEKGGWVFRQCLGNASGPTIDHHTGKPAWFLQASSRTGMWDGEWFSWYYDSQSKKLVPTGFDAWGPFYISGDYLCAMRGFEHSAHNDTTWIYSYKNGKQGLLLAAINMHDNDFFTITFRNRKSGRMENWMFRPDKNDPLHISVTIFPGKTDDYPYDDENHAQSARLVITPSGGDFVPEDYFFEFLTGLDPDIIDTHGTQWRDKLSKRPALKRARIKASGNPEIAAFFQPHK